MNLPDWDGLTSLDPTEVTSRLQAWLDDVMQQKYGADEDELLAELPEPLHAIWVLNWMDFEVTMGSLLGYFGNSHRRHASEAVSALRKIGATGMASVLDRAISVYNANADAWDQRDQELSELDLYAVVRPYKDLPGVDELSELTDRFRELEKHEQWHRRLADFVHKAVAERASRG